MKIINIERKANGTIEFETKKYAYNFENDGNLNYSYSKLTGEILFEDCTDIDGIWRGYKAEMPSEVETESCTEIGVIANILFFMDMERRFENA